MAISTNECESVPSEVDLFKPEYKYYKRRKPPPNFSDVVGFTVMEIENQTVLPFKLESDSSDFHLKLGLIAPTTWQCFRIMQCPGLIFIRNPFLPGFQRFWVKQCLQEYTKKPNKTNLDQSFSAEEFKNTLGNNELSKNLRWVTLGYQYDWTKKLYYPDQYVPFPNDLKALTKYMSKKLGFVNFEPEAGIVNFYHMDSTLGGHTDHSEYDMDAPLFSISFGQKAVFLIGGPTKSTKPTAMFINSGDVIVMSGPARLAYHAVPRIIPAHQDVLEETFTIPDDVNHEHQKKCSSNLSRNEEIDSPPKKIFKHAEEKKTLDVYQDLPKPISKVNSEMKTGKLSNSQQSSVSGEKCNLISISPGKAQKICVQERICIENTEYSILCKNNSENLTFDINEELKKLNTELAWQPFADYLKTSRINMNIRQVLPEGKTFTNMLKLPDNK